MSKIKLLLDVVQDVRALADSLQAVADFIQLGTASPEETPAQPVDSTPPKHTALQITKELLERCPNSRNDTVIVVHPAADRAAVEATIRKLREDGRFEAIYESRTGCTVACHCGPNTIGVMFLNK